VAFQLLPLPVALIRIVSPSRAELFDALSRVIPISSFAPISIAPAATFSHLLRICAYTLVFFLVREMSWRLRGSHWTLAVPLLILATLEGVLGILQFLTGEAAHGTYYNRNHFAGFLEMTLPLAIMYSVTFVHQAGGFRDLGMGPRVKAAGAMIAAGIVFLGILCSLSRMGFIACLSSLVAMTAVTLFRAGFFTWKKALAVSLVTTTILVTFLFFAPEALIDRFSDLPQEEQSAGFTRSTLWRQTLPLIAAYPLFGCGFGGYESAFIKFKNFAPLYTADFAHNDYLQILAELGLVGFVIAGALLLFVLAKALRASLHASKPGDRWLALACTGSITAILVHSLADFNLYIPANAMVLAWISGIAGGVAGNRPGDNNVTVDWY